MKPNVGSSVTTRLNIFADHALHQFGDVNHAVVQVQGLTFDQLVTREGQQLPSETSRFIAGFLHLSYAASNPGVKSRLFQQHLPSY